MATTQTILRNLKNLNQYLSQFHSTQQSAYFEKLIAEVFSHVLFLPFYTIDNDNATTPYRVTWQGSINPISKATQGRADSIAYCYDFHLIVEATKNIGANQWAKEFAPSIRHCDDFVKQNRLQSNEVCIVLVTPQLHQDTYQSIHCNPRHEYSFIPIETSMIMRIVETSSLAFTMRHLELRRLLNQISEHIKKEQSLTDFRSAMDQLLTEWQKEVLKVEKSAIIGVKSYEAMRKIERKHIGISEILAKLQKHRVIKRYLNITGDVLTVSLIEDSLIQQSLAFLLSQTFNGEKIFTPVALIDFKERGLRLIDQVEKIN